MTADTPVPFSLQLGGSEARILADLSWLRPTVAASIRTVAGWIQREGTPAGSFIAGGTTFGPGWATIVSAGGSADDSGWTNGFIALHDLDISSSGMLRSGFFGEHARGPVEAVHWREIAGHALWARSLGVEMRHNPVASTYVEYRYLAPTSSELLQAGFLYRAGKRYLLAFSPQYDLEAGDFRAVSGSITRTFPDFDLNANAGYDLIEDNTFVGLSLSIPAGSRSSRQNFGAYTPSMGGTP